MEHRLGRLIIIFCLCRLSIQTLPTASYYIGAVVNYKPVWNLDASLESDALNNVAAYAQYIKHATQQMADVIVFPEMGLRGGNYPFPVLLPEPGARVNPCRHPLEWSPVLRFLSCSVNDWGIYTVANMDELVMNKTSGHPISVSTHLAFDRNGTVVAKYRVGSRDVSYFDTDMGVRFGLVSDEDLLMGQSVIDSLKFNNVTHVAAPTAVTNRLPFLTGVQMQWSWAMSSDMGLLGAGLSSPQRDMTGSGIYRGRLGALEFTTSELLSSKLLLKAVSKTSNSTHNQPQVFTFWDLPLTGTGEIKRFKRSKTYLKKSKKKPKSRRGSWRESLKGYKTDLLLPPAASTVQISPVLLTRRLQVNKTICQGDLCCTYNITMRTRYVTEDMFRFVDPPRKDEMNRGPYRLAVFNGVQELVRGGLRLGVRRCGLVGCLNESLSSCGLRPDEAAHPLRPYMARDKSFGGLIQTGTEFVSLRIASNARGARPNVLLSATKGEDFGQPPAASQIEFIPGNATPTVLSFKQPIANLITAAVEASQPSTAKPKLSYFNAWTNAV